MITGYFTKVSVPQVAAGEDVKATIGFYAKNPAALYWKTFLVAASTQLNLEKVLDAAREVGQEGGRTKTYTLGKMPNTGIFISFFLFAHDDAGYDWSWNEFWEWVDGGWVKITYLDSKFIYLEPVAVPVEAKFSGLSVTYGKI